MSKNVITSKRIVKTTEIVSSNIDSSSKWKVETISSNNATLETNIKSDLNYTISERNKNSISKKNNLKKRVQGCTCYENKHIMNTASENLNTLNSVNTTTSNDSYQEQKSNIEVKNLKYEYENMHWSGDLIIQKREGLQYFAPESPQLFVQFPDDMMIHRTINLSPIRILVPIPENFVQSQDHFEILTKGVESKSYKDLSQDNFDILIDQAKKKIERKKEVLKENENQPSTDLSLAQEKHSFDINASQKTWNGPVQPVKTNKMLYDGEMKPNWNTLLQTELQQNFNFQGQKKETKEIKEEPKKIIVKKPVYILSKEINITMGGGGFKKKIWTLTPINVKSMSFLNDIKMNTSSSEESIIINDDYNNTNEIKLRSILVTVIKMREEEEEDSESTEAFDVFENIEIKKIELNADISNAWTKTNKSQQNIKIKKKNKKRKKDEYFEINFISNDETFNGKKIFKKKVAKIENEQKNQFDQNVQ